MFDSYSQITTTDHIIKASLPSPWLFISILQVKVTRMKLLEENLAIVCEYNYPSGFEEQSIFDIEFSKIPKPFISLGTSFMVFGPPF